MEANFHIPQRQSKIGVLVLFLDTLQKILRGFAPLLLVVIINGGKVTAFILFMIGIGTLLIVSCVAYLRYTNFTFHIDPDTDEFIVYDGILSKTKTVVQLQKIQQVNITQNLIQRIIRVYGVQVDTAGTDKHESEIKAISHDLALALKAKLLDAHHKVSSDSTANQSVEAPVEPTTFLKINLVSLFKVGITSNYIKSVGLILTFFFSVWGKLHEIGKEEWIEDKIAQQDWFINSLLYSVFFGFLVLFTIVFLLNLVRTVVRYFNYTMNEQKGSLLISFGIINTKNTILRPSRVQLVTFSQNYFQKKLDVLELKIKQAVTDEKNQHKDRIEVPGCNQQEKQAILKLIYGTQPPQGMLMKSNWRRLVFALFLTLFIPLSIGIPILLNTPELQIPEVYSGIAGYVVLMSVYQYFSYRTYSFYVKEDYVMRKTGAWDIEQDILETDKIQAITTSQLFWHKSLNIGSVTLHTAAGNISFYLANFETLKDYVNRWLYQVESQDHNWM
ncbi:MAG: hypothetical protein RLZZ500_2207 [Bacteroidota bacterium]|jgi:putative membrane protein